MGSVYKIIEIVGSSEKSWEDAAKNAIEVAGKSIKDMRVGEVKELDVNIEDGKLTFRVKMRLSFKFIS